MTLSRAALCAVSLLIISVITTRALILVMADGETVVEFARRSGLDGGTGDGAEFPAAELQRRALHVLSGLRDDVDHSVEGIEAVDDRGGPLQHLDAFNLREGDRKRFPEHPTSFPT